MFNNFNIEGHLKDQLYSVPELLRTGKVKKLCLDLSQVSFVRPLDLVYWQCIIDLALDLGIPVTGKAPKNDDYRHYCGRMKLFEGTAYEYSYKEHESSNFFPLKKITSEGDISIHESCQKVFSQANAHPVYIDRLAEAIVELSDNIYWHSGEKLETGWGYIHAQTYPQKGDIRVALADVGIGFYKSYERAEQVRGRSEEQIIKDSFQLQESSLNPVPGRGERGIDLNEAWAFIKKNTGFLKIESGKSSVTVTQVDMISNPLPYEVNGTIIDLRVPIL